jgi:hypothetical protein
MTHSPVAVKADGLDCTTVLHVIEQQNAFVFTNDAVTYYNIENAKMLDHEIGAAKETTVKVRTEEAALKRDLDKLDRMIETYQGSLKKLNTALVSGDWKKDKTAFADLRNKVMNQAMELRAATNVFAEAHGHKLADLRHELESERNNMQIYANGISDGTNKGTVQSLALAQHVCDPTLQKIADRMQMVSDIRLQVVERPSVDLPYYTIADQLREIKNKDFDQSSANTLALSLSNAIGALSMLTELNEYEEPARP